MIQKSLKDFKKDEKLLKKVKKTQCWHNYKNNRVCGNMFPHTTIKQKNIKKSACYTTDKVEILYLFLCLITSLTFIK